jgi:hypothetical protein
MPGDCSSTFMPLREGELDRRHRSTSAVGAYTLISVRQKLLPSLLPLYSTFGLAVQHSDRLLLFYHLVLR